MNYNPAISEFNFSLARPFNDLEFDNALFFLYFVQQNYPFPDFKDFKLVIKTSKY